MKVSNDNQKQQTQQQGQPQQGKPKSRIYVWKRPIRQRSLVVTAATDIHGVYGIVQGSPGKEIQIIYGVHETSDDKEISFLESSKSFNGENEDGFRLLSGREDELLREIMKNSGCRRKDYVSKLNSVVTALNINRSTAINQTA